MKQIALSIGTSFWFRLAVPLTDKKQYTTDLELQRKVRQFLRMTGVKFLAVNASVKQAKVTKVNTLFPITAALVVPVKVQRSELVVKKGVRRKIFPRELLTPRVADLLHKEYGLRGEVQFVTVRKGREFVA